MNFESIDLNQLLTPGVIGLIGLFIVFVINHLGQKFLSKAEFETLKEIASIAVRAAEQATILGRLDPNERLNYAVEIIQTELQNRGIKISYAFIQTTIEAIVLGLEKTNIKN